MLVRSLKVALPVLVLVLVAPASVLAAGDAVPTQGPIPTIPEGVATAITALVVFALVFAVLAVKVWPTIARGLDERAAKIKSEIEAAEKARSDAKAALDQYQKSLAEARAQAQKMLDDAKAAQQVQFNELKARNDAELAAQKSKVMGEIDAAKKAALTEIYSQTATLATNVAGRILRREVNSADHNRLVQDALTEMKTPARV